ncbi:MAG: hypothetical protein ACTSQP_07000 [Promethearchaeota archaeon]
MKKFGTKFKEFRLFFIGFSLITILYTEFAFLVIYTDIFVGFPIRIDFVGYLLMGAIIFLFGFAFGYKKSKRDKDTGIFFGMLFFLVTMQIGVCIFDNIVIIMRVNSAESLDLNSPMEIQFICVYFLTIGQYRFFTILYLISGLICLFYVNKRSELVIALLFTLYIYSSLFLGYLFKIPIIIPYLKFPHLLFYIFANFLIGIIFLIIYSIVRIKFEKEFDLGD